MQKLLMLAALIVAATWFFGGGGRERQKPTPESVAYKVQTVDLQPYDEKNYPKLFLYLGAVRVAGELQDLRRAAAMEAAWDNRCDTVEMSDFSDKTYSSGELTAFVDCRNGFRIWYTQKRGVIQTARN
ncbi:hypothetical protein GGE45_001475 [Rhizobium aethiopicum]|uniref:Uncharacterized protein n=1 Tax=Rhizobium aethiopicum TaxID=1138170 RepID=A0A7W6Q9K4_9HYPH|nr:hypothetical protein [Rhizobium aethiopicum]MBB4191795.1 hypothetical protein [Rhizobium aethiopicum]MBB4579155.1 hypothetical protein [Rhizobium aethiopicum]